MVEGEVIGEINLAASAPAAFDAEHRDIALEIAPPLAIAIQHARLREELASPDRRVGAEIGGAEHRPPGRHGRG